MNKQVIDWEEIINSPTCPVSQKEALATGERHYKSYCKRCDAIVPRLTCDWSCIYCNRVVKRVYHTSSEAVISNNRFKWIRRRAKNKNLNFDLDKEWFSKQNAKTCPALGIDMKYNIGKGQGEDSVSFDRIDPKGGYTKDNVVLISTKANRIKSNANADEIIQVGLWLKMKEDGITGNRLKEILSDIIDTLP